ncbi:MAG: CHAT domain-containing protein [Thermoanaerobaculia bacterium]|nr:CHAT domain-containing protein [Thermoanaerobaculia bacterium]
MHYYGMVKAIQVCLICLLFFSAGCDSDKPAGAISPACEAAENLFAEGNKAYREKNFGVADSIWRRAAQAARASACQPELWAKCRIEMARALRRGDRRNGAARAIDTLQHDLKEALVKHPELAGRFYFHIAYAYRSQDDFWNALHFYEKARLAHEAGPLPATNGSGRFLYKPLANIYTRLGETEKAISILKIASDSCRAQQDSVGAAEVYADLGRAYMDVSKLDSAERQFREGYAYILRHPNPDPEEQTGMRAHILANWAQTVLLEGETDSAQILARAALGLEAENPDAWFTLAEVAAARSQYDSADTHLARVEQLYAQDDLPLNREQAKTLIRRAKLLLERPGRTDSETALRFCRQALQCVLPSFEPADDLENPPERLFYPENTILEALDLKSRLLWTACQTRPERGQLEQAANTAALALAMNDTLTSVYGFESSKLYSLENTRDLHERYLQILFEQHERWADTATPEKIAAFLEKSRALLLRQKLAGEYALQAAPIPPALRRQEDESRQELIYLKNQLAAEEAYDDPDPGLIAQLRSGIFRVQENRQLLLDSLERVYPEYFEARYARPVASLSDIRAMLPDGSALFVEYFYNPETGALYGLGVTRDAVKLFKGNLSPAYLEAFLFFVQDESMGLNREGDPAFMRQFVGEARMLYDTLLAPLTGNRPPEELIVSPDGPLGSLPFDLLLPRDPSETEQSFRRLPYLLRHTRVRFAASATVLREAGALAANADGTGYFGAAPGYTSGGYFAPVRHGKDCVLGLSQSFGGSLILGGRATRERFCREAPGAQILHFYGHGSANGSRPELSYLAFAGGKGRGGNAAESRTLAARAQLPAEEASHVLFAHEISLLRLSAGLVVLSACETGAGRAAGSEGIFSLARAFQDAGCPSAAMTLWSVDDAATARLSELFLQNIRAGQAKDLALQQAKLRFLDEHEDSVIPYYWSGMVLTGAAAPLSLRAGNCRILLGEETAPCSVLWLLAGLLVLVLGLVAAIFRR